MSQVVVLTNRGGRFIGGYDGYGRVGELESIEYAACVHEACWELAGKPEFSHYGSPSGHAADQGWFFDDGDHDMIDPRVTEGREELLQKGVEARTKARYDAKALEVYNWVHDSMEDEAPWRQRFSYGQSYEAGKPVPNKWYFTDKFREFFQDDHNYNYSGTEEEAKAVCQKHWEDFLASDECKTLIAHAEELRAESLRQYVKKLRAEGRYEVRYRPSKVGGDVIGRFTSSREMYTVSDKMTFETVATFDTKMVPEEFTSVPGYSGNHSAEWEARVKESHTDAQARQARAAQEAKRLNDLWAANGYPVDLPKD
jgi:hypothetical protein